MTFVVGEDCINCKHTDCVEVRPVDRFHERPNSPVIHPDARTACAQCDPECPADANFSQAEPPAEQPVAPELTPELAEVWPNITEMKDAMPDSEEWKGKPNKLELLQR